MSVFALSDQVFGDLLGNNGLKPWWEKVRGYFFAVGAASSLSLSTWNFLDKGVKCAPDYRNGSNFSDLTVAQKDLINEYCKNQLPWYDSYAWLISLGSTALILLMTIWWLLHSDVTNAVRTFTEALKIFGEIKLLPEDQVTWSTEPLNKEGDDEEEKEKLKLRRACLILWEYKSKHRLDQVYLVRCLVLFIVLLGVLAFQIVQIIWQSNGRDKLECDLEDIQPQIYDGGNGWKICLCVHSRNSIFIGFGITQISSLFGQCIFTLWGCINTIKICQKDTKTKAPNAELFAKFMMKFWKNAQPIKTQDICNVIKHIFSEKAMEFTVDQLITALDYDDYGFIAKKSILNGVNAIKLIDTKLETGNEECDRYEKKFLESEGNFETLLSKIEYNMEDSTNLIKFAAKARCWCLLVFTIDHSNPNPDDIRCLEEQDLKLEDIDIYGNSILYYALKSNSDAPRNQFKTARWIIEMWQNIPNGQRQNLYVYHSKQKKTLKAFTDTQPYNRESKHQLSDLQRESREVWAGSVDEREPSQSTDDDLTTSGDQTQTPPSEDQNFLSTNSPNDDSGESP